MTGQVVAVASGKGGVGKTTTVVNLGVVLRRADHSVALVDADLGMANLGPMLGVDSQFTLHDVLAGQAELDDAVVTKAPGFSVLPGSPSLTDFSTADPGRLDEVLEALADDHDYVIVDTGAGVSPEGVLPLGLADTVVLVTSPDPAAVENTGKTAELTDLAEGDIAGIVVSKANDDTDAAEVARRVGVDLLGVIPYDATVRESTATGRPLEAVDSETPAAVGYRELADALANGSADPLRSESATEMAAESPADGTESADEPAPDTGGEVTAPDASDDLEEAPSPAAPDPTEQAARAMEKEAVSPDQAEQPSGPTDQTRPETSTEAETVGQRDDQGPVEADHSSDQAPDATDDNTRSTPAQTSAERDEGRVTDDDPGETEDDESAEPNGFLSRIGKLFR